MKKRILSLLLALALLCALLPVTAASALTYFVDVSEGDWFCEAVNYAYDNKLLNGVGSNRFDPNGSMTRAMLVTVLWRYDGEKSEGVNSFYDVPDGLWYTQAVAWAAHNAIVSGVGQNRFDPNGNITREQMAAILYRYATAKGFDTTARGNLSSFYDQGWISSYARDAIAWTVGAGIIGGADGLLLPQGNATRAQVSAILMRFIEKNKNPVCDHVWQDATCFAPKTCTKCGRTEGNKLLHCVDEDTQRCSLCGYRIYGGQAVLFSLTQDYAMGGGCSIFFFEDHTYEVVAGGESIAVNPDGTIPDPYAGSEDMVFISNGIWYQSDDPTCIFCENDDGNFASVNVDDFTDPTVTKYDRILLGYWEMTEVYEPMSGRFTPEEAGVYSDIAFYTDHVAELTLNGNSFMIEFAFQYINEEGDYLYYLYDGSDVFYLYYFVESNEILFELGTARLTYKK